MTLSSDLRNAYGSMVHPGRNTAKQLSIGAALKLYYKAAIVPLILSVIVGIVVYSSAFSCALTCTQLTGTPFFGGTISSLASAVGAPAAPIITALLYIIALIPIGIVINTAIYQLVGRYFLNTFKKGYERSFTAVMYGSIPAMAFYWLLLVPYASIPAIVVIAVWQVIVFTIAMANQQKVTRLQAFGVYAATLFMLLLISVLFMIMLSLGLSSSIYQSATPLLPIR